MNFIDKLAAAARKNKSLLCVGLDPDPALMPEKAGVFEFNRAIIEATADLVCAYKPNFAFYEALGAEGLDALKRTVDCVPENIPVIADAKRGDIGNTAKAYARAIFDYFNFDATTVSPYLGFDSIEPFIQYHDKGVFILCRTSNAGAADFQSLRCEIEDDHRRLFNYRRQVTTPPTMAQSSPAAAARISIGRGIGPNRVVDAANDALASLLVDTSARGGAKGVLFNIVGGKSLTLFEVNEAADVIVKALSPDANIIFGVAHDPTMDKEVKITLIATGFTTIEDLEGFSKDLEINKDKLDVLSFLSRPLFEIVALRASQWNTHGNIGLVVGATYPEELRIIRQSHPDMPLLIPGIGAQGGDLALTVRYGVDVHGEKAIINSSRQIIYASRGKDFAKAARHAAAALRDQINQQLSALTR